jgi:DNA-directed RNA polymerase subunit beta'
MVLGINYLTREKEGAKGENKHFSSIEEVLMSVEFGYVDYQALVYVPTKAGVIRTTPGRVIFNNELPAEIEYVNYSLGDSELKHFISGVYANFGPFVTVQMLDAIKSVGFKYSTLFGATIGITDIVIPEEKAGLIDSANNDITKIQKQYLNGVITGEERYNKVVDIWSKTNENLTNVMMETLEANQGGFNPVHMMATSGARGSKNQIRQLAGMRGLMAKPSGDIIELPIRSNFKEGLSVIEFFISTNGARKGLADTALKTADAGYLTRRLVDIAQDVVINEEDCGTINGIEMKALKDGEDIVESLSDRISGRFTLERVKHPITGEIIVDVNQEITDEAAATIEELGIESVRIRTVLTCESKHGVCQKCYGRNLASNKTVNIGEAVGIIAAQSIGQPGTQLTMRTFHIGGVATKGSEENRTVLKYPVIVRNIQGSIVDQEDGTKLFTRKGFIEVSKIFEQISLEAKDKILVEEGQKVLEGMPLFKRGKEDVTSDHVAFVNVRDNQLFLVSQERKVEIRNGSVLFVKEEEVVGAGETLAQFDQFSEPILAEATGLVIFKDIILGTTLREEKNPDTGIVDRRISDNAIESLDPKILIVNPEDHEEVLASYVLPGGAYLSIDDNQPIKEGEILAKILKESGKTQDITGGLPRVGELFEARRPKIPTVLAKISGKVTFKPITKGKRVLIIKDDYGNEEEHKVPMGKLLLVRDGDPVEAGEPLCDGATDPHDVLDVMGENALQAFLVNEVQEVYRLQGVNINDKHIGVIIRQMMRKVEIIEVGDTKFIYGQQVDKYVFNKENERIIRDGGQAAVAKPLLLGITRASLNIESFISAASFQETTKVLTNAAIAGKVDELRGLKENVIIGHLIPAGTGMKKYKDLRLSDEHREDLDAHIQEILEARRIEKERLAMAEAQAAAEGEILAAAEKAEVSEEE